MKKGDILQALREYRGENCVHYVIFLSMKEDGQSFIGACISSDKTEKEDVIENIELDEKDFEPITPQNQYTITYGNCLHGNGKSYLCKCKFMKDLRWYIDSNHNAKVVGRISEIGMPKIEKILKDAIEMEKEFPYPIAKANQHPELFVVTTI